MRPRFRSLMTRLVVYYLVLSTVVVVLLGLVSYYGFVRDIRRSVAGRLDAVASVKEEVIERWIDESLSEVRQWTALPGAPERVETLFGSDPSSPEFASAYRFLRSLFLSMQRFRGNYAEIFLLTDRGGEIILSTRAEHEAITGCWTRSSCRERSSSPSRKFTPLR